MSKDRWQNNARLIIPTVLCQGSTDVNIAISICLFISETTCTTLTKFSVRCVWLWLASPLTTMRYVMYFTQWAILHSGSHKCPTYLLTESKLSTNYSHHCTQIYLILCILRRKINAVLVCYQSIKSMTSAV